MESLSMRCAKNLSLQTRHQPSRRSQCQVTFITPLARPWAHHVPYLERLSLALASPHSENERHADVWQVHEVLADVNHQLVHEGGSNVEPIRSDIVQSDKANNEQSIETGIGD